MVVKTVRIVIADDHRIIHEGLDSLIKTTPGFMELVGAVTDGEQLLNLMEEVSVDLVILDISMEGKNGIEITKELKSIYPEVKVLILSMHSDKSYVKAALRAGADGYLLKECAFEELSKAVSSIMKDNIFLSESINNQIIREFSSPDFKKRQKGNSSLSPRETEVLQLIAEGLSTKEVASRLELSVKTVEAHRQKIMSKLNLNSVALLTRYAIKQGISSL